MNDPRFTPRLMDARSRMSFPNLGGSFCPWHKKCTAMDCENFNRVPSTLELVEGLEINREKP